LPRGIRLAVLIFVLIFFVPALIRLAVDQLWFQSLGYERVFVTRLVTRLLLFAGVGLAAFAFLSNLRIAMRAGGASASWIRFLVSRRSRGPAQPFCRRQSRGVDDRSRRDELGWRAPLLNQCRNVDPVSARRRVLRLQPDRHGLRLLTFLTIPAHRGGRDPRVAPRGSAIARRVTVEPAARWHIATLIAVLFLLTAVRIQYVRLRAFARHDRHAEWSDTRTCTAPVRPGWRRSRHSPRGSLWSARGTRSHGQCGFHRGARRRQHTRQSVSVAHQLPRGANELASEAPSSRAIEATRRAWGLDSA
jgi:hypothetical protein